MSTTAQLIVLGLLVYGFGYWRGYRRGSGALGRSIRDWLGR